MHDKLYLANTNSRGYARICMYDPKADSIQGRLELDSSVAVRARHISRQIPDSYAAVNRDDRVSPAIAEHFAYKL